MASNPNLNVKDHNGRRHSLPLLNQENRVLDPKKSQNIAILLRALNVTIEEVCEALLEGKKPKYRRASFGLFEIIPTMHC